MDLSYLRHFDLPRPGDNERESMKNVILFNVHHNIQRWHIILCVLNRCYKMSSWWWWWCVCVCVEGGGGGNCILIGLSVESTQTRIKLYAFY